MDFSSTIDGLILLFSGAAILLYTSGRLFPKLIKSEAALGYKAPLYFVGAVITVLGFSAIVHVQL
ncbi:hypothetical protein [Pseudoalteromonas luteoviolacea]|uniref:Uncharacterized protein n=1 Tax=Pseudoalteromonas luteoviolacea H33 TaxID=1365251 RepID=A0A167AHV7_9GAMM|nr:hypothetical protein [Pseudoalteromonas luteoviolacea]KZN45401.1 hypothetical protein N476_05125 [Pseudoalteromonas luteoviolacea H33]KZN70735.1 hypothetical protein N477_04915 [Pseudoalteromonas luteoviolacea H33-S]